MRADATAHRPWEILLVDDSLPVLLFVSQLLQRAFPDARIHHSIDAAEGLRLLERHPIELIISDFKMPTMDGIAFLALAQRAAPSAMRVLLTGEGDLTVAARAINEGHIHAYHEKPVNGRRFVEKTRELLEEGRAKRQRQQAFARGLDAATRGSTRRAEEDPTKADRSAPPPPERSEE